MLLEEGAEVNKEDEVESLTALMAASQCGHDTIVTQLITSGSLVNAHLKTTKWTAVMLAVLNNQVPSNFPLFLPPSCPSFLPFLLSLPLVSMKDIKFIEVLLMPTLPVVAARQNIS